MRLTHFLRSHEFHFKRLWRNARLKKPVYQRPKALADVPIEHAWEKPKPFGPVEHPTWIPPVPDCPIFLSNYPHLRPPPPPHPDQQANEAYIFERADGHFTTLIGGLDQLRILLNCNIINDFPEKFYNFMWSHQNQRGDDFIQRLILQSQIWDATLERLQEERQPYQGRKSKTFFRFRAEYGIPKADKVRILTRGLLRFSKMMALQNNFSASDVFNRQHWATNMMLNCCIDLTDKKPLIIRGLCDHLVASHVPLQALVTDPTVIEEMSLANPLPDISPMAPTIDLRSRRPSMRSIYSTVDRDGFIMRSKERKAPEQPDLHVHTIVLYDDELNCRLAERQKLYSEPPMVDRQIRAAMFAAGHAVVQARRHYLDVTGQLVHPVTVQCIHVGEQDIGFVVFQLNNLDFKLDLDQSMSPTKHHSSTAPNRRNLLWLHSGRLFEKHPDNKKISTYNVKFDDLEPALASMFVAVVANGLETSLMKTF